MIFITGFADQFIDAIITVVRHRNEIVIQVEVEQNVKIASYVMQYTILQVRLQEGRSDLDHFAAREV